MFRHLLPIYQDMRYSPLLVCLLLALGASPVCAQFWLEGTPSELAAREARLAGETDTGLYRLGMFNNNGDGVGYKDGYVSFEGFTSLFNAERDGLWFTDGRLVAGAHNEFASNLGMGFRKYFAMTNSLVGFNFFYDYRNPGNSKFDQLAFGLESLGNTVDCRLNAYFVISPKTQVETESDAFLSGTALLVNQVTNTGMSGFDTELGVRLPFFTAFQPKLFVGGYHYQADGLPKQAWGVQGRLEVQATNRLNFHVAVQNDRVFGTTAIFGGTWMFPSLNGLGSETTSRGLLDRLGERIRRREQVVLVERQQTVPVTGPAGPVNVYFVDQTGGGDGTQANPYTVAEAQADANFGAGDVIVLLDSTGTIVSDADLSIASSLQLVGGGDSGSTTVTVSGSTLNLTGLGGRPVLDGTVTLGDDSIVSGFTIDGSAGDGVASNGGSNGTISDLIIQNTGGGGIVLTNHTGTVDITSTTIMDTTDVALQIDGGDAQVNFDGTITQTTGAGAISVANVTGGGLTTTGTIDVSNMAGGTAIDIDANGADYTVDISNATIDGNNLGNGLSLANLGSGGTATFSSIDITAAVDGVSLSTNGGSTDFTDLTVATNGGIAFSAQDAGTVTVSGTSTLDATGEAAVDILNTDINLTFDSVTSTGSSGFGMSFDSASGSFTVSGATTITNPTGTGISIVSSDLVTELDALDIGITSTIGVLVSDSTGSFRTQTGGTIEGDGVTAIGIEVNNLSGTYLIDLNNITLDQHVTGFDADVPVGGVLNLTGTGNTWGTNTTDFSITGSGTVSGTINFTNSPFTVP